MTNAWLGRSPAQRRGGFMIRITPREGETSVVREWVKFADVSKTASRSFEGAGLTAQVLSEDPSGVTFSAVVTVPVGWNAQAPAPDRAQYEEIYVIAGDVRLGDTE